MSTLTCTVEDPSHFFFSLFVCYRGLMYGYSVSGVETENSAFANLTNRPVPSGFSTSIIPSLLFGSLISATDPGERGHRV